MQDCGVALVIGVCLFFDDLVLFDHTCSTWVFTIVALWFGWLRGGIPRMWLWISIPIVGFIYAFPGNQSLSYNPSGWSFPSRHRFRISSFLRLRCRYLCMRLILYSLLQVVDVFYYHVMVYVSGKACWFGTYLLMYPVLVCLFEPSCVHGCYGTWRCCFTFIASFFVRKAFNLRRNWFERFVCWRVMRLSLLMNSALKAIVGWRS